MTEIKQLRCPNCSGLVTAPPGVTRVTCTYCGADLAVDLDKEEAMLYALDQQERSREKDRLAEELKPLYEQYMAVYNQLSVVDIELQQRELLKQNYTIRHQVKGLTQRHDDLVRSLSLISSQIAKIDEVVHPGIVTQIPVPRPLPRQSRWPAVLRGVLVFLVVVGVIGGAALVLGRQNQAGGNSGPPLTGPQATATAVASSPPTSTGYYYAKETSHSVSIFAKPFADLGGLAALGFPVTEAFVEQGAEDGANRWVQYFEKAELEYHPELPEGQKYQLSRLGAWRLNLKYKGVVPEAKQLPPSNNRKFDATGYVVADPFLSFWDRTGGLARFGYPLSSAFDESSEADGKPYTVQYFERAIMEHHPELSPPFDVQLAATGLEKLKQLYPDGPPMHAANPVPDTGGVPPSPTTAPSSPTTTP